MSNREERNTGAGGNCDCSDPASPLQFVTSRRGFLRRNAMGIGSVALAWLLRQENLLATPKNLPKNRPTFDLKPKAPDRIRGEFRPIDTSIAGIQISEHFPRLAPLMEHAAVLRGMSTVESDHQLASPFPDAGEPDVEHPDRGDRQRENRDAEKGRLLGVKLLVEGANLVDPPEVVQDGRPSRGRDLPAELIQCGERSRRVVKHQLHQFATHHRRSRRQGR